MYSYGAHVQRQKSVAVHVTDSRTAVIHCVVLWEESAERPRSCTDKLARTPELTGATMSEYSESYGGEEDRAIDTECG